MAGRVAEVARRGSGRRSITRGLRRRSATSWWALSSSALDIAARRSSIVASVALEAVGVEQRALDQRPRRRRRRRGGAAPSTSGRADLARAPVRHGRGHPRALGVELRAVAEADRIARRRSACVTASRLNARWPRRRRAAHRSAPPGRSWATSSPSNTPIDDRVRAGVERAVGRRLDLHGREHTRVRTRIGIVLPGPHDRPTRRGPNAQDRDPLGRPDADRQARRRRWPPSTRPSSAEPRSGPRSSAPTSRPSRSSTSSWARCSRPARARFPRARRRSRAGSPRRSPRRRSTRCAPRGFARPRCSTTRSARATSTSGVGGGMESMSKAPYLLKEARFGFRMGDGKAIDAMINDGLTNPFSRQAHGAGGQRGRRRARAEPAGPRPLGAPLAPACDQGDRRGTAARGDRAGDDQGQEGRHGGRDRRGAAARHDASRRSPSCRRSS